MIFLDELDDLKLYKKEFYLPTDKDNRKKGSLAFILSDLSFGGNGYSSILGNTMLNNKFFYSYYIEKDITYIINQEGMYLTTTGEELVLMESGSILNYLHGDESDLIQIPDNLPEVNRGHNVREYLDERFDNKIDDNYTSKEYIQLSNYSHIKISDKLNFDCLKHVRIGEGYTGHIFLDNGEPVGYVNVNDSNHCIQALEVMPNYKGHHLSEQLLDFAIKSLNADNLTVSEKNEVAIKLYKKKGFKEYHRTNYMIFMELPSSKASKALKENSEYISDEDMSLNESANITSNINNHYIENITDYELDIDNIKCYTESESIVFGFHSLIDSVTEADASYNSKLHRLLYNERFRTPKEVVAKYKTVKEEYENIKNTFLSIDKYKNKNLFIDLSYYNESYFKHAEKYKADKGVALYYEFVDRLISDKRFNDYTVKTVLVPLNDKLNNIEGKCYDYLKDINILSIILRLIKSDPEKLTKWDMTFLFISDWGYFKFNPSKLDKTHIGKITTLLRKLVSKEPIVDDTIKQDSTEAIVANITDELEKTQGIKFNGLTGDSDDTENVKQIVDKIKDAAQGSKSEEETYDKLDNDEEMKILVAVASQNKKGGVDINATRRARLDKLHDEFLNTKVKNKTLRELMKESGSDKELPVTSLNLDTINEEWQNLRYINFEKIYDINADILRILDSLSKKKNPIMVRDIDVKDTSTSEDIIETWTVKMEDAQGQRFTFKFDLPKFVDKKFMFLRGNRKIITGQLVLLPMSKTDNDTTQLVSNYNKIFLRRYGLSTEGKTFAITDRIIKAFRKCEDNGLKIIPGDNSKVCNRYELPIDYLDFAQIYSKIKVKSTTFYFNQDEIRELYKDKIDLKKGLPYGYDKVKDEIIYYKEKKNEYSTFSSDLLENLSLRSPKFVDCFNNTKTSAKYHYSQASILSSKIPLIVILAYLEGLTTVLSKAKIKYQFSEKKRVCEVNEDVIKFRDSYLYFTNTYEASMLLNGLKDCNTEDYDVKEIDHPTMYLDFLDSFGGRLLADGIDNFYDCMIDPMTEDVMEKYMIPNDFVSLCIAGSNLLVDNKYIPHTSLRSNRYRTNELLAGYAYKCISSAYGQYAISLKKGRKAPLTMKQSAIIDAILLDNTCGDKSSINALLDWEDCNSLSFKGLVGMNSDRSYSLDKRTYDETMVGILAMSTGFAGNVGVNRQSTIDMNIEGTRGYLKIDNDYDQYNITKMFCPTEALTPFGATSDDPFRSAMTFIQTAKHMMRTRYSMPNLITNGADQAMPYFTSDTFSFKAKEDGTIVEYEEGKYFIIKYKDGSSDYVSLEPSIEKNSNGGIYIGITLKSKVKLGQKVKANDVMAYDPLSFSGAVGYTDNLAYNAGVLCKTAVMNTDEGFEDSTYYSEWMAKAMSSDVIIKKEVVLPKNVDLQYLVKKGQPIKEGESLMIFQNAYDDEDVNILLKNLSDEVEDVTDFGKIPITSHVEGVIEDVKIYRTCEIDDEMSESVRKVVTKYENEITKRKKMLDRYGIDSAGKLAANYKLPQSGKLKNVEDGILVEIYCKYEDDFSVGDKLVNYSALKGVAKNKFPLGLEPYTDEEPNEKIHSLLALGGIQARMVGSVLKVGAINRVLIELDRWMKRKLDIPIKYLDEIQEEMSMMS